MPTGAIDALSGILAVVTIHKIETVLTARIALATPYSVRDVTSITWTDVVTVIQKIT
jgi:hypothetical protein